LDGLSDGSYFTVSTNPGHGNANIGAASGVWSYTPTAHYNGSDTFAVTITDDDGYTAIQQISLTITSVNDVPVATTQTVSTDEDQVVTVTLLATDVDGNTLTYTVLTQPSKGTLSGALPSLTYTPEADYNGSDSFTFKASDGSVDSNMATVTITVTAANDAPTASDQSFTTKEDQFTDINLTTGDIDGDTLIYSVLSQPSHGVLTGTAPNLTYTPNANYSGSDTFTFKVNDSKADSNTATVTIMVEAIADTPTITPASTTPSQQSQSGLVVSRSVVDGEEVGWLQISVIQQGQLYQNNGITAIQEGKFISWQQAKVGLKFTPQQGFQGMASFQLQAATSSTEAGLGGQIIVAQIEVQSQLLSCQLSINQGLNLVGLPLQPESDWHLPQLLAVLPADFLFYYDGSTFHYYGGGESSVLVEGGVSYVVVRNQPGSASVELTGQAWDNVNDGQPGFRVQLQPAINMISVPLQPAGDGSFNLQQLFEQLPIDFLFYYDGASFQFYNGGSTSQVVKAGSGYVAVRNADQAADYVYRGSGWQSSLSLSPAIWFSAQQASDHQTGVMAVVGQLNSAVEAKIDQLQLQLINHRSGQRWWSSVSAQGSFSWTLLGLDQPDLIRMGDQLAVQIDDGRGGRYRELELGAVTARDIRAHRIEMGSVCLEALPEISGLGQNYPNPFNPETWIPYQLHQESDVSLRIYSSDGTLVRRLDLGFQEAGAYLQREQAIHWDGRTQSGEQVASGFYFYRLQAGDYIQTRKMVILK